MPDRSRNRPRDPNELARQIVDEATGKRHHLTPMQGRIRPPLLSGEGVD
ncbi:MAG: hypothetical protein H0U00_11175 [Actinobacteria bacterium]|nr:hypothetical protein [Actinomycetota bacterium]